MFHFQFSQAATALTAPHSDVQDEIPRTSEDVAAPYTIPAPPVSRSDVQSPIPSTSTYVAQPLTIPMPPAPHSGVHKSLTPATGNRAVPEAGQVCSDEIPYIVSNT